MPSKDNSTKRMEFAFGGTDDNKLNSVIHGKGFLFTLLYFLMMLMFIIMFFFLVPFTMELKHSLVRLCIVLVCFGLSFIFARSLTQIVIEHDNIQFATFKRPQTFFLDTIRAIRIYYFSLFGLGAIKLTTDRNSRLFVVMAPSFQRERYELFFDFLFLLQSDGRIASKVTFKS